MSAHRYWRVYITGAQTNPYVSAAEIQMFVALGGANVCSGGTAFSSSYYAPESRTPDKAFDGVSNTGASWTNSGATNPSVANPEWIGYDFGAGNDKDIIGFNWSLRNDSFWSQAPSNLKLQYSDDNSSWTDRFAPATQTWTTQNETRNFFDPAFAAVIVSKVVVQILRTNGTETPSTPDTTPGTNPADALDWAYLGATNYLVLGSPSDYTLDWEYLGEPVTITNLANAVGGLAAVETGADTASISGAVLIQGALVASESGSDVASFQGAPGVHGSLAASESGSDTFAATGRLRVTGTASLVEQAVRDVLAATGSVLPTGQLGVVAWPASLPLYPASYGEQAQPVIAHTDPDAGPTRTRRRFTRAVTKGQMEFLLTIAQQVALDDFWTRVMQSGANPVNLYHPWSGSVMQMRIPEAPSYASDSNLSVRATFGVEYFSS